MKETIKKRALLVRDFILARGKIVFPILLIAAVAITVAIVLQVIRIVTSWATKESAVEEFVKAIKEL